jgi:hypothetical protein
MKIEEENDIKVMTMWSIAGSSIEAALELADATVVKF